jgi:hypothetical protein
MISSLMDRKEADTYESRVIDFQKKLGGFLDYIYK